MADEAIKEKIKVNRLMARDFIEVLSKTSRPKTETWSFIYGHDFLGAMCAVNGSLAMHSIRRQLNLRPYARMTCYGPVAALSYVLAEGFHGSYINQKIMGFESCPLCIVIKAGLIQTTLGVIYPLFLSPIIGFYLSDRLLTYPVPSISKAPKELFQLFLKMTCRNPRFIYTSIAVQFALASIVTYEKQTFFLDFISKKV